MDNAAKHCRMQEIVFRNLISDLQGMKKVAYGKGSSTDSGVDPLKIARILLDTDDMEGEQDLKKYVELFFMDHPYEMAFYEMSLDEDNPFQYTITACACMEVSYLKARKIHDKKEIRRHIDHLDYLGRNVIAHGWMLIGYWTGRHYNPGAEGRKKKTDKNLVEITDLIIELSHEKDKIKKQRLRDEIKKILGLTTDRSVDNYRKRFMKKQVFLK